MRSAPPVTSLLVALALLLAPPTRAHAQQLTPRQWADTVRLAIDAATRSGGLPALEATQQVVARALAEHPDDALLRHYEGFLLYRMVTVGGASLAPGATTLLLERARAALTRSIAQRPMAESHLLLSEIYSRQIVENPARGASLGPAMALARARAMSAGSDNPRVYLIAGISALYAPREVGGGIEAAEQLLQMAIELFRREDRRSPYPTWGHAEAYAWLGQVYARTARRDEARAAYVKALALEPDNSWVRDVLLPQVR